MNLNAMFTGAVLALPLATLLGGMAQAQTPIDASNETVVCNTLLKASVKFKPSLVTAGAIPGITQIKGSLGGCSSSNPGITFVDGKSSFKGTISGAPNDCAGLLGPSVAAGSIVIKWKTVEKLVDAVSTVNIAAGSAVGGLFVAPWGAAYGQFDLGAPGGTPLSVTGAFTGGTGGAGSHATVVTLEDAIFLGNACNTIKGIKGVGLGIGQIRLE